MDTLTMTKAGADLRDYLAEERTFLAWIRTGLAVMAFGFVAARFGLSVWFGAVLIGAGVAVNLSSTRRYIRLVAELKRGQLVDHGPSLVAIGLALFLALVGIAVVIYLTVA
jgi:putative membrane protein